MRPDTRVFLERVRDAENPSRADEERVLRALQGSLAAGLGATALTQSGLGKTWIAKTAAALGSFGSKLSLVAALGAAALGGGDSARSTRTPVRIAPVDSSVVRLPPSEPAQKVEERRVHEPERSLPRAPEKLPERASAARERRAAPPRAAPLRAELELLREVQAALRSGDGAAALRALDAHRGGDRRLLAERQAARILALCQVGRIAEARRAALEFANNHPGSVQGKAIANSCASAQRIRPP